MFIEVRYRLESGEEKIFSGENSNVRERVKKAFAGIDNPQKVRVGIAFNKKREVIAVAYWCYGYWKLDKESGRTIYVKNDGYKFTWDICTNPIPTGIAPVK